jgi:parallel beta-helix repeat protein
MSVRRRIASRPAVDHLNRENAMRQVHDRSKLPLLLGATLLAACAAPDDVTAPRLTPSGALAAAAPKKVARVKPGMSIQAAVDAVGAGGTVQIEPGVYAEAVNVAVPDLHILGVGGGDVVLANPGGANNGIRVADAGDGFELDNVTVRDFLRNGVILIGVDGFRLSRVRTVNNGEYGLFPLRTANGVIENCTATGHADTGIYVGQSTDVVIRNSAVWANVAGFEIENTVRGTVENSLAYDNTVGVLVSLVPGLQVMTASDAVVRNNLIHDNNHVNFGDPEDLAGLLPAGSGVIVVGPDRTLITGNTITNNASTGVAVVDAEILAALAGLPPGSFGVDTKPDGTRTQRNLVLGNGAAPQPPIAGNFPGVDLLWDGTGVGNCWSQNVFLKSAPSPLPACR